MKLKTINKIKEIKMEELKKDYLDRDRFLELCRECENYDKLWSCPPYSFDVDECINRYNYAYIIGTKMVFSEDTIKTNDTPEKIRSFTKNTLESMRGRLGEELLNLEDYMDKTVIFITHDMNEAFKLGDRIALLRDGEVVQTGKPKDFFDNPADEYVKSFIEDVDKSRIIRVKTVMREPDILPDINAGAKAVLKSLKASGEDFCYVVDEQGKLAGYVDVNTLENSGQTSIKNLVQTDYESMSRNAFLSEAWSKLSDSDYDVAIVDKTNKLRGVINHEDIVNALA